MSFLACFRLAVRPYLCYGVSTARSAESGFETVPPACLVSVQRKLLWCHFGSCAYIVSFLFFSSAPRWSDSDCCRAPPLCFHCRSSKFLAERFAVLQLNFIADSFNDAVNTG